jgi:hypothetical protein
MMGGHVYMGNAQMMARAAANQCRSQLFDDGSAKAVVDFTDSGTFLRAEPEARQTVFSWRFR